MTGMRTLLLAWLVTVMGCSGSERTTDGGPERDGGTSDVDGATQGAAGCGKAAAIATGSWVVQQLLVAGETRDFYLWLPAGYDPQRAYPIVYQFHGCSSGADRQNNNVPIEKHSGGDAIIVRGKAKGECWDTSEMGPDVPYFDALVPAVEGAYCVDAAKRDATGYSSGSFMTHVLGCIRGAQLRAVATIAGGQAGTKCTGSPAALLIHDENDPTVNINASIAARDDHVKRNGCDAAAALTPTLDPLCGAYTGCMPGKSVVWCKTTGKKHDRQDGLAGPVFWKFFSGI